MLEAYRRLHAAGIVHQDLEPRHIRIDKLGNVRLIDFEGSRFLGVGAWECWDEERMLYQLLAMREKDSREDVR